MKLAAPLLLSTSLAAQCFGTYPPGVVGASISPLDGRCTPQFGGPWVGPWCSPQIAFSSLGGTFRIEFSEVPFGAGTVAPLLALVNLDLGSLPAPVALPGGCAALVGSGIGQLSGSVTPDIFGTCQTAMVLTLPPIPGLAGLQVWGQGFVFDPSIPGFSTSNVWICTVQ